MEEYDAGWESGREHGKQECAEIIAELERRINELNAELGGVRRSYWKEKSRADKVGATLNKYLSAQEGEGK